jgi:hypothetical protein
VEVVADAAVGLEVLCKTMSAAVVLDLPRPGSFGCDLCKKAVGLIPGLPLVILSVTLASNRKAVKVDKDSAMLLRVVGSGPEEVQARTTPSRATGQ